MVKLEMIKELALKANLEMCGCGCGMPTKQSLKFAELIVRECARVIDRGDGEMSSMAETIWCNVCRDDILKHFGVE